MMSAVVKTDKRQRYADFSPSIFEYPTVILTNEKNEERGITLGSLSGWHVGTILDYAEADFVRRANPRINVVPTANAADGLRQVSTGSLDACVMSLPLASHYMEVQGIQNLIIAGDTGFTTSLGLATQQSKPELTGIIAKAINSLSQAELREISRRWVSVREAGWQPSTTQILYALISLALVVIIVFLLINLSLKKLMQKKTEELEVELEERRAAEEALRISDERFQLAVQGSNTGILDYDLESGEMFWSDKLKELLGYPADFVPTPEFYREIIHKDDVDMAMEAFRYQSQYGGNYNREYRLQRRSGNYMWFHVTGRFQLRDGKPVRMAGSVVDVNARHEAEQKMREARLVAEQERKRSEELLLNILPEVIAEKLKDSPSTIAESFEDVTVLFADIEGFTTFSAQVTPEELVMNLNHVFSAFDVLAEKHGLEKIKTIGDAYMIGGGLPLHSEDHAESMAEMALDMLKAMEAMRIDTGLPLNIRIGMNSGPVVAGVIGSKKFITICGATPSTPPAAWNLTVCAAAFTSPHPPMSG